MEIKNLCEALLLHNEKATAHYLRVMDRGVEFTVSLNAESSIRNDMLNYCMLIKPNNKACEKLLKKIVTFLVLTEHPRYPTLRSILLDDWYEEKDSPYFTG